MSKFFGEVFNFSELGILSLPMTLSEIHKRMIDGQNLDQMSFDLEIEGYNMEQFRKWTVSKM